MYTFYYIPFSPIIKRTFFVHIHHRFLIFLTLIVSNIIRRKKATNLLMVSRFLFVLSSGSEFYTHFVVQILQDLLHVAVHCLCGEFFLLRGKGYGEGHGLLLGSHL